jgi:hypothetical protein
MLQALLGILLITVILIALVAATARVTLGP